MSNKLLGLTLTIDEYHGDTTRISKSGLDLVEQSPLHYYGRYLDPNRPPEKEKAWAKTGNAVGTAITEPDRFALEYACIDDRQIVTEIGGDRPTSTKIYKAWYADQVAQLNGKTELPYEQYKECCDMRDSVYRNRGAVRLFKEGQAERSFYYQDQKTGVWMRIRPDWLAVVEGWVVDVKTSISAAPDSFARSVANYRYHVQDPFYMDGLKANGIDFKGFCFVVVEKTYPYPTGIYFLPKEAVAQGRKEIRRNLDAYAKALKSGVWPGYSTGMMDLIDLPAWAYNK